MLEQEVKVIELGVWPPTKSQADSNYTNYDSLPFLSASAMKMRCFAIYLKCAYIYLLYSLYIVICWVESSKEQ